MVLCKCQPSVQGSSPLRERLEALISISKFTTLSFAYNNQYFLLFCVKISCMHKEKPKITKITIKKIILVYFSMYDVQNK